MQALPKLHQRFQTGLRIVQQAQDQQTGEIGSTELALALDEAGRASQCRGMGGQDIHHGLIDLGNEVALWYSVHQDAPLLMRLVDYAHDRIRASFCHASLPSTNSTILNLMRMGPDQSGPYALGSAKD